MKNVIPYLFTILLIYGNLFFIVVNFHKIMTKVSGFDAFVYSLNILSIILLIMSAKKQFKKSE